MSVRAESGEPQIWVTEKATLSRQWSPRALTDRMRGALGEAVREGEGDKAGKLGTSVLHCLGAEASASAVRVHVGAM